MADGAAANGFPRHNLRRGQAMALYRAGYPCPPDTRLPSSAAGASRWQLSAGGVPIPPLPNTNQEFRRAIYDMRAGMNNPENYPLTGADEFWWQRLTARRNQELEDENDNGPVEGRFNSKGRRNWWSAPGRTLEEVLEHIRRGNQPRLQMPPLEATQPWVARRPGASSSSATSSSSAGHSLSTSPPFLNAGASSRRRSGGALRIGEPQRVVRPKTEDADESEDEWPDQRVAEQLSLDTLQPLDVDTAARWSLRETTEAELALQRRLLAEAEQRKAAREREAAAAAARLRVPPPPPQKENEYIILDPDSDDEGVIQNALEVSRWDCGGGDEGQGGSRRPGDPPSDDDDDDGGDYSQAIAASLGLA